jgi:inorganic pyrophosphatase
MPWFLLFRYNGGLSIAAAEQDMSLQDVPVGRGVPNDVNVIVEIPMNSPAIKYEVDKASGAIFVDRMLKTSRSDPSFKQGIFATS